MTKKKDEQRQWLEYSSIGLMFPASIAVGLAIGYFLDKWLKTEPVLLMLGIAFGIGAGFYNVYKITRQGGSDDSP